MTRDDIETANAIFYRDTQTAFTAASIAAWREQEAAEKQRRDDLMARWLEAVWNKEDAND